MCKALFKLYSCRCTPVYIFHKYSRNIWVFMNIGKIQKSKKIKSWCNTPVYEIQFLFIKFITLTIIAYNDKNCKKDPVC